MTERELKKLDGKKVRFKKQVCKHSIHWEVYEGFVEVTDDDIKLVRGGKAIVYPHIGFYLEMDEGDKLKFFHCQDLQLIKDVEVI